MSHMNGYFKKIIGRPEIAISPRPQIHLISRGFLPNLQSQWNAGDNLEKQIQRNDDTGLKPSMGYVVSDNIMFPKYNQLHESGNKEKQNEPKKNEEIPGKPEIETLYSGKILIGHDLKNIVPEDVLKVKSKDREGPQEPKTNEEIPEPGKLKEETLYSGKILIRPDLKNIVPDDVLTIKSKDREGSLEHPGRQRLSQIAGLPYQSGNFDSSIEIKAPDKGAHADDQPHNIVKKIVHVKKDDIREEAKKKVEIKNTSAKDLTSLSPIDNLINKTPGYALHGKRNDEPSLVIKKIDIHIVDSRGAHSEKAKRVNESRTDILTRSYLWRFDPG